MKKQKIEKIRIKVVEYPDFDYPDFDYVIDIANKINEVIEWINSQEEKT